MLETTRGSQKVMEAWRARGLTERSVEEIAKQFDESPAVVEGAELVGGEGGHGMRVSLSYTGDDVPICGNDLRFWLHWHRTHGGKPTVPRIIINGKPFPDLVQIELDFGVVAERGA